MSCSHIGSMELSSYPNNCPVEKWYFHSACSIDPNSLMGFSLLYRKCFSYPTISLHTFTLFTSLCSLWLHLNDAYLWVGLSRPCIHSDTDYVKDLRPSPQNSPILYRKSWSGLFALIMQNMSPWKYRLLADRFQSVIVKLWIAVIITLLKKKSVAFSVHH